MFTRKLTLSSTFRPSTVLVRPSTARISLPGSRSILKPTKGYRREEAGISSTVSLSSSFRRAVACLDLDLLAEKRETNSWSSLIFSSFFLFWSRISRCIIWLDSYQNS